VAVFDSERKEELEGIGGEEFFIKMMRSFASLSPAILQECRGALDSGDLVSVKKHLHKLKGSALNVGAQDLAAAIIAAEGNPALFRNVEIQFQILENLIKNTYP